MKLFIFAAVAVLCLLNEEVEGKKKHKNKALKTTSLPAGKLAIPDHITTMPAMATTLSMPDADAGSDDGDD